MYFYHFFTVKESSFYEVCTVIRCPIALIDYVIHKEKSCIGQINKRIQCAIVFSVFSQFIFQGTRLVILI